MGKNLKFLVTGLLTLVLAACGSSSPNLQGSGSTCASCSTATTPPVTTTPPPPTCITGATAFDGGSGTSGDPYLISKSIQIYYTSCNNNAFYKLNADIDFSVDPSQAPIYFLGGGFDGSGHKLSNLTQSTSGVAGLFGTVDSATVQNVTLVNVNVTATSSGGIGGLAGKLRNAVITNCTSSGNVTGSGYAGGLVGYSYQSTITNSSASAKVNSQSGDYSGGLVGNAFGSTFTKDSSSGSAAGSDFVGGLVGYSYTTNISSSFATSTVTGLNNEVGGLVGGLQSSSVDNCYATGAASGEAFVGGLVGYNEASTIQNAYAAGLVNGVGQYGGLVGSAATGSTAAASYWDETASNQSTSAEGSGENTAAMQTQTTYSGWDFTNTWQINAGAYPTLR